MHNPLAMIRPLLGIVPPHLLRELARNGTRAERDLALRTLATDQASRGTREIAELGEPEEDRALARSVLVRKRRTIYDGGGQETLPGTIMRNEGSQRGSDIAGNEAYEGLGATWDFYHAVYQRNSIDDAGLPLDATVHYGQRYDNAFWDGHQLVFGDGDGKYFNRYTVAVDVIGHELTHGVTGHEAKLRYFGQPGALNESISDVFGSLVKQFTLRQTATQADWLIGAGLFTSRVKADSGRQAALRSMRAPGTAYHDPVLGRDPQPGTMARFVHTSQDNGGVHLNSGIPNRAFFLVATKLGGHAWEHAGRIWYETLRDRELRPTTSFLGFAFRTVLAATRLYGGTSRECQAVLEAWRQVGVMLPDARTPSSAAA
jgi:Zn-dependent metalloprotease